MLFRSALPQIAALTRHRRWTAWGKTTQMRGAALDALSKIGTPKARDTISELARNGDFFLRRLAGRYA